MNSTGKNKYSKEFKVPEGFDDILRNLTRGILRSQPEDINKFGKFYLILVFLMHGLIQLSKQHTNISRTRFRHEHFMKEQGGDNRLSLCFEQYCIKLI